MCMLNPECLKEMKKARSAAKYSRGLRFPRDRVQVPSSGRSKFDSGKCDSCSKDVLLCCREPEANGEKKRVGMLRVVYVWNSMV
jgi:hypothetical protein